MVATWSLWGKIEQAPPAVLLISLPPTPWGRPPRCLKQWTKCNCAARRWGILELELWRGGLAPGGRPWSENRADFPMKIIPMRSTNLAASHASVIPIKGHYVYTSICTDWLWSLITHAMSPGWYIYITSLLRNESPIGFATWCFILVRSFLLQFTSLLKLDIFEAPEQRTSLVLTKFRSIIQIHKNKLENNILYIMCPHLVLLVRAHREKKRVTSVRRILKEYFSNILYKLQMCYSIYTSIFPIFSAREHKEKKSATSARIILKEH
jgi:hypothetical protein